MKYLLGADIGTTSLKAAVFDETGKMIKSATKDYTLIVSGDTVEFPAEDYFELFLSAYNEIIQLCCDSCGYLPTENAEKGSHYSAYVSSGQADHIGGDLLVRKTLTTINSFFKNR